MRTLVGYIPGGYLNSAASPVNTGSQDAETLLPINTGLGVGQIAEYGDSDVAQYSNGQVIQAQILTAGSGQTNGTYTATASTGGATISYTIAGNALTAATVTYGGAPGTYTTANAPTFTIAAGGTPGTIQAVIGQLWAGTYEWVQLDPSVTGLIVPGTALYWLQTATAGQQIVTNVASNASDYAGVSIDPNFGAAKPNAFIQINGKMQVLYAASGTVPTTFGDVIQITSAAAPTTFNAVAAGNAAAALNGLTVGYNLGASQAVSSVGLIRNTRSVVRF